MLAGMSIDSIGLAYKKGRVHHPSLFAPVDGALSGPCQLKCLNVFRLQALWTLHHVKLHRLAFLQAAEAAGLDCREMHEDIPLAGVTADETITLGVVEPLHCSFFHCRYLYALNC
jgi:hypothetical protein